MIERSEISAAMAFVELDPTATPAERNKLRRQAVINYLSNRPNSVGLSGSEHDMILDDLKSYPEWEREGDGRQEGRTVRNQALRHPRPAGGSS